MDIQGRNQSKLEVRSSFYDLCMQKTTVIVYPTVSVNEWANSLELTPHLLPFYSNRDTFVAGSTIDPLAKPQFYMPSILFITPDVKFQVALLTG